MKYCTNCGSQLTDDTITCPNCKTTVKRDYLNTTAPVQESTNVVENDEYQYQGQMQEANQYQPQTANAWSGENTVVPYNSEGEIGKQKKSRKKLNIILAGVGLVAAIGIVVGLILMFGSSSNDREDALKKYFAAIEDGDIDAFDEVCYPPNANSDVVRISRVKNRIKSYKEDMKSRDKKDKILSNNLLIAKYIGLPGVPTDLANSDWKNYAPRYYDYLLSFGKKELKIDWEIVNSAPISKVGMFYWDGRGTQRINDPKERVQKKCENVLGTMPDEIYVYELKIIPKWDGKKYGYDAMEAMKKDLNIRFDTSMWEEKTFYLYLVKIDGDWYVFPEELLAEVRAGIKVDFSPDESASKIKAFKIAEGDTVKVEYVCYNDYEDTQVVFVGNKLDLEIGSGTFPEIEEVLKGKPYGRSGTEDVYQCEMVVPTEKDAYQNEELRRLIKKCGGKKVTLKLNVESVKTNNPEVKATEGGEKYVRVLVNPSIEEEQNL